MVCVDFGLVLALLYKSFALSLSWAVLVVRVGSLTLNPSPPLAFHHSQPWMGCFGLCDCARGEVIGAMGCGKWVWVSCEWYLGGGLGLKPWGRGGMVLAPSGLRVRGSCRCGLGFVCTMAEIGCSRARIGPSKSSQSLSIAHKWAVEID
ncbi:hypothetical protein Tco_1393295 [Tanacetum coccineum]